MIVKNCCYKKFIINSLILNFYNILLPLQNNFFVLIRSESLVYFSVYYLVFKKNNRSLIL